MNHKQFVHKFFYDESDEKVKCTSMSYCAGVFYSYDTAVARIVHAKSGEKICLIAGNFLTSTTARHLRLLRSACPFTTVEIPVYYEGSMSNSQIFEAVNFELSYLSSNLQYKENRINFLKYYDSMLRLLDYAVFSGKDRSTLSKIKRNFKKHFDIINSPESLKELKKKVAEKARKDREKKKRDEEKAKKRLSKLIKGKTLTELVQMSWGNNREIRDSVRLDIRKILNPSNRFSFLFQNGEEIETTQGLSFPVSLVKNWLGIWKSGNLKIGDLIDKYKVLRIEDKFVQIGCHRIPTKNLNELCEILNV